MKSLEVWLGSYLRGLIAKRRLRHAKPSVRDILFCVVDHFEPIAYPRSTLEGERRRMRVWIEEYPRLAARHRDSDGVPPQHTWFYPGEAYRAEYLEALSGLCRLGLGEIELHLHHGNDTPDSLRRRLTDAIRAFNGHGALITQGEPEVRTYAFIHGNMALDNSMGDPKWCGVNSELQVLQETGCYADFSMPTAPAKSQTKKINAIYYAIDDPTRPKSHNTGVDAEVGGANRDGLLIIQGPLALDWRRRRYGLLPRIDNAEIIATSPATAARIQRWARQEISVSGRPEWIMVKASCHGAEERNFDALLGIEADRMYSCLEAMFRDAPGYRLHYVTARELLNIVRAAESGLDGDPRKFRDFSLLPYQNRPPVGVERGAIGVR